MSFTIGTDGRSSIPLSFRFVYNGTTVGWGQPYRINDLSNSGESVDGDYRITDFDGYFADPYGSIFLNHFGNGTVGLGSSLQVVAYHGGTLRTQQSGIATSLVPVGTAGAFVATIHTGKIYGLSYSNRIVRVRSKCRMANIANLKWQFPVHSYGFGYTIYGSYAFRGDDMIHSYSGSYAMYDLQDTETKAKLYAYVLGTSYGPSGYLHVNGYPPMAGRGTGTVHTTLDDVRFYYPGTNSGGTNFYSEREPIKLEATYFGELNGTITTHEEAMSYGYSGLDESESEKVGSSTYPIYKTRLRSQSPFTGSYIHFIEPIVIEGNPKVQFEHMIHGAMVTPLFTSDDIDTSSLAYTGSNTAYFYMRRKVWFNEKKVVDSLKDLFNVTQSLFFVNTSNKLEYRTYGPLNMNQSIDSFGTNDLIRTSFDNYEEDFYNRFVLRYKYDSINDEYGSIYETKSPYWAYDFDRPLELETKFITNPNEASLVVDRLNERYKNTFPHISMVTNLNKIGIEIGSLYMLNDPNNGINNKVIQITGYRKSWKDKTIDFDCLDAEAVFLRKGYAFWEGDNSLTNLVSGTSTSGWGTGGTVENIDESIYGTVFNWW